MSNDDTQNLTDLYTIEYFSYEHESKNKVNCIKISYDPKFKTELRDESIGDCRIWRIDTFINLMNENSSDFQTLWGAGGKEPGQERGPESRRPKGTRPGAGTRKPQVQIKAKNKQTIV